jgi:hypothetical protein
MGVILGSVALLCVLPSADGMQHVAVGVFIHNCSYAGI